MTVVKALFIGGTGLISAACVEDAQARGIEVTLLNRGLSATRPAPTDVEVLHADVRDSESVRGALGNRGFDVVVDFIAFRPEHVQTDIDVFEGRCGQYVFISSAAAYQTPPARLPILESTILRNPFWPYAQDKIACEDLLVSVWRERGFPVTIVRPSHTYDRTQVPTSGGWTDLARMRRGAPVVVHGDGTTSWTLTHSRDFALAFGGLLGRQETVGDVFHITSDETLTWNQIYSTLGGALGIDPVLVHVASDTIARALPALAPGLLGDKVNSAVFDNSKIKSAVPTFQARVPFAQGAREIVDWYLDHEERQTTNAELDKGFDRLIAHTAQV